MKEWLKPEITESEAGMEVTSYLPAELDRAREYLVGTHEIGLQRNAARAMLLALDACYGLGLDSFEHYGERVQAVTTDDVQRVAARILQLDRSALAVVGP